MQRVYLSVIFPAARAERARSFERALKDVARRQFGVTSDGAGTSFGPGPMFRDVGFPVRDSRHMIDKKLNAMEAAFTKLAQQFNLDVTFERDANDPED